MSFAGHVILVLSFIYPGAIRWEPVLGLQEPPWPHTFALEQVEVVVAWDLSSIILKTFYTQYLMPMIIFQHTFLKSTQHMCDQFEKGSRKLGRQEIQYEDNMHNYCCRQLCPPEPLHCLRNTSCAESKLHPAYQCWNLTATNTQACRVWPFIRLISWYFKSKYRTNTHVCRV